MGQGTSIAARHENCSQTLKFLLGYGQKKSEEDLISIFWLQEFDSVRVGIKATEKARLRLYQDQMIYFKTMKGSS